MAVPSCSRRRVYGVVKAFARCLADRRAPGKIRHTLEDPIGQQVFGLACGHPDGDDADHLADDPILTLLFDRDPLAGAPSQDRSGPESRPDAWRPATHVIQRALRWSVLSAVARVSELRPRCRAVSVRGGAAAREGRAAERTLGLLCRLVPLLRADEVVELAPDVVF